MATEVLYASSQISGSITSPANAIGSATGTWAGLTNSNTNTTDLWAIANPVNPLTTGYSTHTVEVLARKGSNSGSPTLALNLYENGTQVGSLAAATTITSTTGQIVSGTFTSSNISDPNNIEIQTVITGNGGSGSTRNSVQIDTIKVSVDTTPLGGGNTDKFFSMVGNW